VDRLPSVNLSGGRRMRSLAGRSGQAPQQVDVLVQGVVEFSRGKWTDPPVLGLKIHASIGSQGHRPTATAWRAGRSRPAHVSDLDASPRTRVELTELARSSDRLVDHPGVQASLANLLARGAESLG
jgi:hypothetical protein